MLWRWVACSLVGALAGCGRISFDAIAASSDATDSNQGPCVIGGTGTLADPYVICTAPQLLNLMDPGSSAMWSAAFHLGANLDLTGYSEASNPPVRPIGTMTTPFSGEFNGANHKIMNLMMSLPAQDGVGLFGFVSGSSASVHGVHLVAAQVVGHAHVGALVGRVDGGASVFRSSSTGTVTAIDTYAGGLVGTVGGVWVSVGTPATVSRSWSSATVMNVTGDDWVGGLVGNIADMGVCADSYATGTVNVRLDFAGGLAGGSTGIIRNSYASGSISGVLSIGGLAGGSGGQIISSFSTGNVSGMDGTRAANLIGQNFGTASMSASLATSTCTVQINGPCHAPVVGETSVATLAQLLDSSQAPMSAWDFQSVWLDNGPGQYPTLR